MADVIVVGLGAMGSAAACQLARRGLRVIGIDRFSPPHTQGSSHGETRITRQAVGEGPAYVPFVQRSHEIWRDLEEETGESLFLPCGTLVVSARAGAAAHHNKIDFLAGTIGCATRFGIAHEVLEPDDLARRFPQLGVEVNEVGYFEPGGGLLYPERCIATQLRLAARAGAIIRTGECITDFSATPHGVRLTSDQGTYEAGHVVMAAGAWMRGLVGRPLAPLSLQRQVLHWFAADRPELYRPERFPVFIWIHGSGPEDLFYGFPIPPGSDGVKVTTESIRSTQEEPEAIDRTVRDDEARSMFDLHVRGRLRYVSASCLQSATCLYTVTPDANFVIDRHPDEPRILLASPCSGHGFKHSAAIGEAIAENIAGDATRYDLSAFALSRFH